MDKMCNKTLNKSVTTGGKAPSIPNKTKGKEKRRNNEKRKEKSRDAARCRRSRETEIFADLANVLPICREDVDQLDKASIMRLSIAYLKTRGMLELFPAIKEAETTSDGSEPKDISLDENLIMQALDGFLLILSAEGDITYVSETVAEFIGIQQIDMVGQQIWDYSHQCDHDELREILNGKRGSISDNKKNKDSDLQTFMHRDIFLRLKCTLTSRGRNVNIKSASYKVIHISGHIAINDDGQRQFISVGRPIPHPSNIEVPLDSSTFLTKHSLDMKFTYVDDKMHLLLGYQPEHLMDKSLYEYHHGADSESLLASFKCVISKGQAETFRYRFLAQSGGYCWVVTQATLVYDKQKPQSVVCVNYIISGIENKTDIYSCAQLESCQTSKDNKDVEVKKDIQHCTKSVLVQENNNEPPEIKGFLPKKPVVRSVTTKIHAPLIKDNRPRSVTASVFSSVSDISASILPQPLPRAQSVTASVFTPLPTLSPRPQPTTSKIFVPRTEDMNKGFLMFLDEGTELTMLKEEPDDLTHLAPTAGDACIPLDESAPLFGEMFEGLILPDGYGTLLQDDINSLDSQTSKTNVDPFMNYRDESSESGTHLLSPGGTAKSPNGSSLPSLCSPNSLSQEDEFAFMTMTCDDDIDLTMRAPYIPMNENDDLPLLTEDLMWSAFSEELSLHKDVKEALHNQSVKESSLAALLSVNGIPQTNQHSQNNYKKTKLIDKGKREDDEFENPVSKIGPIYNKNSSNVETWTMTDLLQLNNNPLNEKSQPTIYPVQMHTNTLTKKYDRTMNKRPLNASILEPNSTKRIKGTNSDLKSSPQLLQQLMAPTPQQRARSKGSGINKNETSKWDMENTAQNHIIGGMTIEQTSNSVLKNLLVSGCDENLSMKPPDILLQENIHTLRHFTTTTTGDPNTTKLLKETINDLNPLTEDIRIQIIPPDNMEMPHPSAPNNTIHSKIIISNIQRNEQYMENHDKKTRKISFSSLDGDPLPIPIQSLLLELSDQDIELNIPINETAAKENILATCIGDWTDHMT